MSRPWSVAAGLVADRYLGEPPTRWHPTAWFGTTMGALERRIYADRRSAGVVYTAAGVALGAAGGLVLHRLLGRRLSTAAATALAVAGRMLDQEATAIGGRLEAGDLDGARVSLRSLVGRRPDGLDEAAISRAVIESVAENTVDAVTAAAWWALVGGAPAVLAYRAVNTMDAMVGHHNDRYERFGWASARLDDVANWLPARATAAMALVPMLRPGGWALVRRVIAEAAAHPSPNGGLIEAAYAHRLGVTLGGTNRYGGGDASTGDAGGGSAAGERIEHRGLLGGGPVPGPADISAAVGLRRGLTGQIVVALAVAGGLRWLRRARVGRGR